MKIHAWVPDYTSAMGGIQTLSRAVVTALQSCLPNAAISVFAKNDTSTPNDTSVARFFATGGWTPRLRTAVFSMQLLRYALSERPDLIMIAHANFAPVAHLIQKLCRIPYVVIGNGIEVWDISDARIRAALKSANLLLAISECTRQRMAATLQIPDASITLFPCTFDQEKYRPGPKPSFLLQRFGLTGNEPVILTVTRLSAAEQYKGYDQVLRALPSVCRSFPTVRYILAGRGSDHARIEALVAELGLAGHVILPGYVADEELSALYNLCDVFAMPSKGEGFGIVFLEALSCGKPVIAGNKDGSVDAIMNGKLGVLVDPERIDDIAGALTAVLRRTQARETSTQGTPLRASIPDIVFEPAALREAVIDIFGYERFQKRVGEIIRPFVSRARTTESEPSLDS